MTRSILIGPSSFATINEQPLKKLKDRGFNVINNPFKRKIKKNELIDLLTEDVIGLIAGLETLDNEVLTKSNLKIISRVGSGLSNIDQVSLKKNKIGLYYIPDGPTQSVAELTIANIINLLRKTIQMNSKLKSKNWYREYGNELSGKTVLIIGFGKIGMKVSSLLKIFGAKIMYSDPYINNIKDPEIEKIDLHDGIPKADIICVHASGNKVILSEKEFKLMKQGVLICNPARGELIDEAALIKAITNNSVSGAWLDTFEVEPYMGEMLNFDNVICTSHLASYTYECRENMENIAVDNLINNL